MYAREAGTDGARLPLVVALHARGADAAAALHEARQRFGARPDLLAPQAARPCNPFQSNLRSAAGYAGFSWYLGDDPSRPEAASFGDALAALDDFVAGIERDFVLSGDGQGAVLAATLALYAPHGLVGIDLRGASATASVEGWEAPHTPLAGLSVRCLDVPDAEAKRLREVFGTRGAGVSGNQDARTWLVAFASAPEAADVLEPCLRRRRGGVHGGSDR